jgi:hypothetical protein
MPSDQMGRGGRSLSGVLLSPWMMAISMAVTALTLKPSSLVLSCGIALFGAFLTHRLIPAFVPLFVQKNLWGIDLNKPREPLIKM